MKYLIILTFTLVLVSCKEEENFMPPSQECLGGEIDEFIGAWSLTGINIATTSNLCLNRWDTCAYLDVTLNVDQTYQLSFLLYNDLDEPVELNESGTFDFECQQRIVYSTGRFQGVSLLGKIIFTLGSGDQISWIVRRDLQFGIYFEFRPSPDDEISYFFVS